MQPRVDAGIRRLTALFGDSWPDITLAFRGGSKPQWVHFLQGGSCRIETLTTLRLRLHHFPPDQHQAVARLGPTVMGERDLITEWLLDFALLEHPVWMDTRPANLLRLLIAPLGNFTQERYHLLLHSALRARPS